MARKRRQSNAPKNSSPIGIISQELLVEILSLLSVKAIVRFKCVSKSWNNLISNPTFVEKHLKISSQNPHLTLSWYTRTEFKNVVPFPVHRLLNKPSATVSSDDFQREGNMFLARFRQVRRIFAMRQVRREYVSCSAAALSL
ncbi:F-box protein [Trifolium medium]|uniref:F-box protein n=1 Tax=Trifolium medium TaxID=97028 RepID=A0A392NNE0_9FABA|nr:F-box protein [Trifolium medium]